MIGIYLGIFLAIIIVIFLGAALTIVQQANRYVIERFGAYTETLSVGIHFVIPFVDRIAKKVSIKEQVKIAVPQPGSNIEILVDLGFVAILPIKSEISVGVKNWPFSFLCSFVTIDEYWTPR